MPEQTEQPRVQQEIEKLYKRLLDLDVGPNIMQQNTSDDILAGLRSRIAALEGIAQKALTYKRSLAKIRASQFAAYEDKLYKLRAKPKALIVQGFAYQEREATYQSDPVLIPFRVKLREVETFVADVELLLSMVDRRVRMLDNWRLEQMALMKAYREPL